MRTDLLVEGVYVAKPWRSQRQDIADANARYRHFPVPRIVLWFRAVRLLVWKCFFLNRYQFEVHGVDSFL